MLNNDSNHRKKSAFPPNVTLYDEKKVQFGCGYLETAQEMARTENLCPLSAPHQQLLSDVRTASAFVVHYYVLIHAAPQSQSFTP